jgi:flagellar biosynthesis GTPase FlhF
MNSSTITSIPMNAQEFILDKTDIAVFDMNLHKCNIIGDKIVIISNDHDEDEDEESGQDEENILFEKDESEEEDETEDEHEDETEDEHEDETEDEDEDEETEDEDEDEETEDEEEERQMPTKPPTITRFNNTDIVLLRDSPISYDQHCTTEKDIIEIAIREGYPVIVKNGNWYLKGKNKPMNTIKNSISENKGKYSHRVYCLLLENEP